jgi:hypothetical protein
MVTDETQGIFGQIHASQRIIALCPMFLYCSWQLMLRLFFWGASTRTFYIQGGRGYKEGNWVCYNVIPIRTLSLLDYFTYISIDIVSIHWGA